MGKGMNSSSLPANSSEGSTSVLRQAVKGARQRVTTQTGRNNDADGRHDAQRLALRLTWDGVARLQKALLTSAPHSGATRMSEDKRYKIKSHKPIRLGVGQG